MYRWSWRFRAALLLSLLCNLIQHKSHVAVAEELGETVTETTLTSAQTQNEQGETVRTANILLDYQHCYEVSFTDILCY